MSSRDKDLLKKFGDNIRKLRKERNLSQEKLADIADLQLSQIGRIERGEINTTISTVRVLANALNLNMSELFQF